MPSRIWDILWRLTSALEKYIVFPDGVDFATMLGERSVFVGPVGGGKKAKAITRMTRGSRYRKAGLS